jgi:Flp pilus assembly pilin Flp
MLLWIQLVEGVRHVRMRLNRGEEGQALVEYALILSLVSIAAITILGIIGTDVDAVLDEVAEALVPGSGDNGD